MPKYQGYDIKNQRYDIKNDILVNEYQSLRAELRDLKDCQVRFLTFSVTATGIILGLIAHYDTTTLISLISTNSTASHITKELSISGLYYLIPLTVIFPAWLIFFDKATTITRAVAYFRLLESYLLGKKKFEFIGFENSLALYRDCEKHDRFRQYEMGSFKNVKHILNLIIKSLPGLNRLSNKSKGTKGSKSEVTNPSTRDYHTKARYWILVNITFFGLSAACFLFAFKCLNVNLVELILNGKLLGSILNVNLLEFFLQERGFERIIYSTALIILFITIWKNLVKYIQLTVGKNSYHLNYEQWETILKVKDVE